MKIKVETGDRSEVSDTALSIISTCDSPVHRSGSAGLVDDRKAPTRDFYHASDKADAIIGESEAK